MTLLNQLQMPNVMLEHAANGLQTRFLNYNGKGRAHNHYRIGIIT